MRKYNNKILIVVLVVLVATFVLSRMFRAPGLESNMRKTLITIDTAAITEIKVVLPQKSETVTLTYRDKDSAWQVVAAEKEAEVDAADIKSLLRIAAAIKLENMVARKKKKWDTFDVGDSSAIRVSLYAGLEKQADFRIGSIGFSKNAQRSMYTHVRVADEEEVYATKAFLRAHFDKGFNDWRSKALLRLSKEEITKVSFNYPDSGFVLKKRDSLWYIDNQAITLSKAEAYLNKLHHQNMTDFDDAFRPSATPSPLAVQVAGGEKILATLKAWPAGTGWVVNSSLQEKVYFADKQSRTVKDLFVSKGSFVE